MIGSLPVVKWLEARMPARALKRILLVEDDAAIQSIAAASLRNLGGFTVEVCGSARDCLVAAAADFRPDLVLLDIVTPGMDRFDTLKALREAPATATTPVVFITGKTWPPELSTQPENRPLGIIPKPLDAMTLPETIRRIWGESDVQAEGRDEFAALERSYEAELPGRLEAIARQAASFRSGEWDEERLMTLFRLVHTLAGSAAIYGFDEIGREAHELELLVLAAGERKSAAEVAEQVFPRAAALARRATRVKRDL